MLSNNGYVRGEYAVIGKTVYAGTKLSDYRLNNDEFTKHYLTTKEYVDSKIRVNSIFSVKSGYTHQISEGKINAYSPSVTEPANLDIDGKLITISESFSADDGYIIKEDGKYSIGIIEDGNGTVGYQEELDLGQQLYSELDNQIYTLIEAPIGTSSAVIPILVPETLSITISNNNNNDVITFDKLYNDTVYHKLTINPLSFASLEQTIDFTIPSSSTSIYGKYIEYCLQNYAENSASKIISLSAFSGIHNNKQNEFTALLFETSTNNYTAIFEHTEGTSGNEHTIINTINLTYNNGSYTDSSTSPSSIIGEGNYTYYLIDYYNNNVVKVILTGGSSGTPATMGSPTIETINTANDYFKDLSLLAEFKITKNLTESSKKYTVSIRALSSPENQKVSDWTVESSIILNTYRQ